MNHFDKWKMELVTMHSASILMRISILVGKGVPLDHAKARALKEHMFTGLPDGVEQAIRNCVAEYSMRHICKEDKEALKEIIYREAVKYGHITDNWLSRFLWRWFALTI